MNQEINFVLKILCVEGCLLQGLCTEVIKSIIISYRD